MKMCSSSSKTASSTSFRLTIFSYFIYTFIFPQFLLNFYQTLATICFLLEKRKLLFFLISMLVYRMFTKVHNFSHNRHYTLGILYNIYDFVYHTHAILNVVYFPFQLKLNINFSLHSIHTKCNKRSHFRFHVKLIFLYNFLFNKFLLSHKLLSINDYFHRHVYHVFHYAILSKYLNIVFNHYAKFY